MVSINSTEGTDFLGPPLDLVELNTTECTVAVVIYTAIALTALVGNSAVVFIVVKFRRLRTPTNMLILNLALADLLMSIFCIPLAYIPNLILTNSWPFGAPMCKVIHFCQILTVLGTSYTLIAISFDRFLAILFPLHPNLRLSHSKDGDVGESVSYQCSLSGWSVVENATGLSAEEYGVLVFALQFWMPLVVLIFTYTSIGIVIWRSRSQPGAAESTSAAKIQEDRRDSAVKMILTMLLVTVLFVVCWFPQNILMNYLYNYEEVSQYRYIYHVWWGTHTFAMSHSIVNPIVYVCRNKRFREGFTYVFQFLPFVTFTGKELDERRRRTMHSTIRMVTAYVPVLRNGSEASQTAAHKSALRHHTDIGRRSTDPARSVSPNHFPGQTNNVGILPSHLMAGLREEMFVEYGTAGIVGVTFAGRGEGLVASLCP